MPDLLGWAAQDGSVPSIDSLISWGLPDELKKIVAEEMTVDGLLQGKEIILPEKVDVLDIRPLLSSASKKFVLHVYTYPHESRIVNMPKRLGAIAARIKLFDEHFADEGCVAVSFKRVEYGDWAKA